MVCITIYYTQVAGRFAYLFLDCNHSLKQPDHFITCPNEIKIRDFTSMSEQSKNMPEQV
jgi:hypothetical protein